MKKLLYFLVVFTVLYIECSEGEMRNRLQQVQRQTKSIQASLKQLEDKRRRGIQHEISDEEACDLCCCICCCLCGCPLAVTYCITELIDD